MNDFKKLARWSTYKKLTSKKDIKKFLKKIVSLNAKPSHIAFSIALGIFIGMLIPIGLQTVIALPFALMLECNLFLTMGATLISNPVTVVPMYYSAIRIGEYLTSSEISWDKVNRIFEYPTFQNFADLGKEGLIIFFTGSFIQGIIAALIIYLITNQFVVYARKRKDIQVEDLPIS
ncbi:MAG: DUF2062 domain-containing protein [Melioribacteraceae bacterium]|nr:DUF2062 domain-containing protein [Melioribacteraceae bacterium]MCF8354566.1 DUF2062 domain-containing protein [Melioribacteraceae bacterium]MCF8394498.1 DUF2062 domain-containing protein [Melioribacteraceae bacterium]MCF8420092.1 DUF2062 domain-containing protein [Melioribacteraceae bacterium]